MSNFDIAQNALQTSLDSSGSAMKEHERWSQSLEARLLKLKASWQSFAQTFMDSDFLKSGIEVIRSLVDLIEGLIDNFGILGTLGLGAVGKGIFSYFKGAKEAKATLNDVVEAVNNLKNTATESAEAVGNMSSALTESAEATSNVASATTEAAEAATNLGSAASENAESISNMTSAATENAEAVSNMGSAATESAEALANMGSAASESVEAVANLSSTASEGAESIANLSSAASEGAETIANLGSAGSEGVETIANLSSIGSESVETVSNLANAASEGVEAVANLGIATAKTGGAFKAFIKTGMGKVAILGAIVAAVGLAISAYQKYKQAQSEARQEAIKTSDEFLDSAKSFEQAYIKYSGRTSLSTEEEAELESAIKGTVEALDDKSNALNGVINSSNDYVASLERITNAELKAAEEAARVKKDNAELELRDTVLNAVGNSTVDILFRDDESDEAKIAKDIFPEFWITEDYGRGSFELELPTSADADTINSYYESLVELRDELSKSGFTKTPAYNAVNNAIGKMQSAIEAYTDSAYDAVKAEYQLANGIPKTTDEYLKMRESIITDVAGSTSQRLETANKLDSQYGQSFDLTTIEAQARKFVGILSNKVYGDDGVSRMETFLNMRTAVNDNECTVGEYISQFDDIKSMQKYWTDEEKEAFNLSFGIDTDKVKTQYDKLHNDLNGILSKTNLNDALAAGYAYPKDFIEDKKKEIDDFLNGLSQSELSAIYNLKGEIDWETDSPEEILTKIKEEAEYLEAVSFTIDISVEKEKLENLSSALSEAVSGTGLSTEGVSIVESMFGDLSSYDPSKLFERTANGIRLNTDEFRKLNDEYGKTNMAGLNKKMSALGDRYNKTREELYSLTYGTEEYKKKSKELTDIEDQINALETLGAQYKGLASAYNQWQMAESAGSQRDMYESIIEGFENVDDEISRGWIDDGSIEFLELLTGRTDLATMSAKELKEVYKGLKKDIDGTSYSVRDFFTVDDEGNSTSQGVFNFLEAIDQLKDKKFGGKNVIKRDDKENIIEFDFQAVGGDKVIAETLGISEELVQIMKRAADDAGFVVSLDGTYQQLDVLKEKAQTAAESLNKTLKESGKKGFEFNFNSTDVDDIKKQLTEAGKILDSFRNKDGTVNMELEGADEALTVASTLQSMLDRLTRPTYMEIEISQVEKEVQKPLQKLQELRTLTETEHQLKLSGADTTELDKSKQEIYTYFENLDPEVKAEIGLVDDNGNPLTGDALKKKLESGDLTIEATVDIQMEMDEKLGILVDKALLEAGIITEEEFEKRVKVYLKTDEVDDSDVEEKTENSVENQNGGKSVIEKPVDITLTGDIDYSSTEEKIKRVKENLRKRIVEEVETPYSGKTIDIAVDFLANTEEIDNYTPKQLNAIVEYIANTDDIESYTPEQKEALVEYFANTSKPDSYTPEEKQAIVDYLSNTRDPDNYTPEEKEAIARFIRESGDPDRYQPDPKTGLVTFNKDSSVPDGYNAPNPVGLVTFNKDSSKVDTYDPPDFVRTVTYKIKEAVSNGAKAGKKVLKKRFGIFNGTANSDGAAFVDGTYGRAFRQGNWRTKKSETALTGELGREIVVTREGRWYTVGDNGAEFVNIPRGSIVFNHKQTEQLLNNGKATADGGRAKALVNGTALLGGTAYSGTGGGLLPETNNSSDSSDKFEETFDWIEIAISRLERAIDNLDKTANNVYKSWSSRNNALTNEIAKVGEEISLQRKAASEYRTNANNVKLNEYAKSIGKNIDYEKMVRNGAIDISTITDEDLAEKIKDYQKWYEKILACEDAIQELKETEAELYAQRFENIQTQYEGILQGFEHTESMLNEYIAQAEAQGHIVSKKYYEALISNEKSNIAQLKKEQSALIKSRDEAVASGAITKYSESW